MIKGILLLILIAAIYQLWRYRQRKPNGTQANHTFHGVSIEHGLLCCRQAEKLQHQRFLSAEAPTIPLPGCDQQRCQCRYKHYDDRRNKHNERRDAYGVKQDLLNISEQSDRRKKRDRRKPSQAQA